MTQAVLKPSPLMKPFERELGTRRERILDIGCNLGRNSLYLARLGHSVVALDNRESNIQSVQQIAKDKGIEHCHFVVADGTRLPFKPSAFSAVILSEMLHMLPKVASEPTLEQVRDVTAPGGINVVSGYFVGDESVPGDKGQYFVTNELRESYENAGWLIRDYHEDQVRGAMFNDKFLINSLAWVVARKPY